MATKSISLAVRSRTAPVSARSARAPHAAPKRKKPQVRATAAGYVEDGDGRQGALARGIGVLQCFTTEQPAFSSMDLVERSGLPKPTAFRTISKLCELGLLQFSEQRGRYMLAPGLMGLCAPLLAGMAIRPLSRPMMQEFADYAQGLVSLVVGTSRQRPLFVELAQGRGSAAVRPELGTAVSLPRSSSGRAFLGLICEADRKRFLEQIDAADPDRGQWLRAKLEETQNELRNLGYCRNMGELDPVTVGVAVPVRMPIDGQYFVFGCTVPSFRLVQSPALLEDLGMRLASLVQNIEAALGISPP